MNNVLPVMLTVQDNSTPPVVASLSPRAFQPPGPTPAFYNASLDGPVFTATAVYGPTFTGIRHFTITARLPVVDAAKQDPANGGVDAPGAIGNEPWQEYTTPDVVIDARLPQLTALLFDGSPDNPLSYQSSFHNETVLKLNVTATDYNPGEFGSGIQSIAARKKSDGSPVGATLPGTPIPGGYSNDYERTLGPGQIDVSSLGNGIHVLEVVATDGVGQQSIREITVKVDRSAPITDPLPDASTQPNGWYNSSLSLQLVPRPETDAAPLGPTTWTLDHEDGSTLSGAGHPGAVAEQGLNTLRFKTVDTAHSPNAEAQKTATYKLDTVPPSIDVMFDDGTQDEDATNTSLYHSETDGPGIVVTASDAAPGSGLWKVLLGGTEIRRFTLDGDLRGPAGPRSVDTGLGNLSQDGTYVAAVVDAAGNTNTSAISVKIDRQDPTTAPNWTRIEATGSKNLATGWYLARPEIELTASDAGSGVASICYRWTGDTVAREGCGPSPLDPGKPSDGISILTFYALDQAHAPNRETDQTLEFKVDTKDPTVEATLLTPGLNGWTVDPFTLQLVADDEEPGSGVQLLTYSLDNGPIQTYTGNITGLSDGRHTIQYVAEDAAGRRGGNTTVFDLDATPPTLDPHLVGELGPNGWFIDDVRFNLNASDEASGLGEVAYSIDGGNETVEEPQTSPTAVTTLIATPGIHEVRFRAMDKAGQEAMGTMRPKVDTAIPSVEFLLYDGSENPNATAYHSEDGFSLTLFVQDEASGLTDIWVNTGSPPDYANDPPVATYSVDADGRGNLSRYSQTLSFDRPDDGITSVFVLADDAAGRRNLARFDLKVDRTAPNSTLAVTPAEPQGRNGWYTSVPTLSLSADDGANGSGVSALTWSWSGNRTDSGTGQPGAVPQGLSILTYAARDWSHPGNVEASKSADFMVDSLAPETTDNIPVAWQSDAIFLVELTAAEPANGSGLNATYHKFWKQGQSEPATYAVGDEFEVEGDGVWLVRYYSDDVAGNAEAPSEATLRIDTEGLVVTHSLNGTAGTNNWYRSNVTVNLTVAQQAQASDITIEYRIDGAGSYITYTGPFVVSAEGTHTIDYRAFDAVDEHSDTGNASLKIDKTAPTTSHNASAEWIRSTAPVVVGLSAADGTAGSGAGTSHYKLHKVGTTEPTNFTTGTSLVITGDGTWRLKFRSVDAAGNAEADKTADIKIDGTPPTATITSATHPKGAFSNLTSGTFNWTVQDATSGPGSASMRIDNGTAVTSKPAVFATITEGAHVAKLSLSDVAGNTATVEHAFKVDKTPPTTNVSAPAKIGPKGGEITVSVADGTGSGANATFAQFRKNGGNWTNLGGAGPKYAIPMTGLVDNDLLEFRSRARDAAGNLGAFGTAAQASTRLDASGPAAPANLRLTTPATDLTPTLSWSASTDANGVSHYALSLDAKTPVTVNATGYTFPAALLAGAHTVDVSAVDGLGNAGPKATVSFTVDNLAPGAVSGLRHNLTSDAAILFWDAATDNVGVARYVVALDGVEQATVDATTYTFPQALSVDLHTVTVAAVDAAGNRGPASEHLILISPLVDGLKYTRLGNGVRLEWTPSAAEGVAGYLIWRSQSPFVIIATINDPKQSTYTDTTLDMSKDARYVVTYYTGALQADELQAVQDSASTLATSTFPDSKGIAYEADEPPAEEAAGFSVGYLVVAVLMAAAVIGLAGVGVAGTRARRATAQGPPQRSPGAEASP